MGVFKEMLNSNEYVPKTIDEKTIENVDYSRLTFKVYTKKHCLFLIADILKINEQKNMNFEYVLMDCLIYCFNKGIKKPRVKLKNNKIILFSQKYNYSIYLKTYYLKE